MYATLFCITPFSVINKMKIDGSEVLTITDKIN